MIDDDEDDYEGYFLRPANEYNIKEKIIQANQESFAIPTPPSPRHHANGERRVTFREQLVDYEPDDYSSEDDGYGGGGSGGGGGGSSGGGGLSEGSRRRATIETVADVHRDGDEAEAVIEELHLDDRGDLTTGEEEEVMIEEEDEEQLEGEGDYDDDGGEGAADRMEKHKTGVEGQPVASEEDDDEEEEEEQVPEEEVPEEEEESPTDGSSMDTEIHNPESSEDISSSPLKTYRSEADSRSGSGDSQGEEAGGGGGAGADEPGDENEVHYEDDNDDDGPAAAAAAEGAEASSGAGGGAEDGAPDQDEEDQGSDSASDGERPIEAHRAKRSANCKRKCCRHKKSAGEKLPYYNGYRSEYGLSREELEEKKRRLEARRQRVRERQQRRTAEQRQKAQSNEEAFAAWLHGKLRSSINKHQNMYDVRQQQHQQQQHNAKNRRRNAIHQISYG